MKTYRTLKFKTLAEFRHMFDIGIFGSYQPPDQEELLRELRDHLRAIGFSNAFLVKDFPDADFKNTRDKSYYLLHTADAVFFIITKEGKKMGVTSELEEYFREVKGVRAAVFEEIFLSKGKMVSAASSMVKRILTSDKLRTVEFSNRDELFMGIEGMADNLFYETSKSEPERLYQSSIPIKQLCQVCNKRNSECRCLNVNCTVFHLCESCAKLVKRYFTCSNCSSILYKV